MERLSGMASAFDWVVGGPVRLYHYLLQFPIIFIATFVISLIVALGLLSELEGTRRFGFIVLTTYLLILMQWLVAHLIWKI